MTTYLTETIETPETKTESVESPVRLNKVTLVLAAVSLFFVLASALLFFFVSAQAAAFLGCLGVLPIGLLLVNGLSYIEDSVDEK